MKLKNSYIYFNIFIAFIGVLITLYLSYIKIKSINSVCIGSSSNCDTVLNSRYSYFLDIPVVYIGLLGYISIILISITYIKYKNKNMLYLFSFFAFVGFLFSIYLTYTSIFIIGSYCTWCLTSLSLISTLFFSSLLDIKISK